MMISHQDEALARSHQPVPRGTVVSRKRGCGRDELGKRRERQPFALEGFSYAYADPTRRPHSDRMEDLGLDREALGFRLGAYKNPLKAAGRVHALINGHITTEKSRRALARLADALEVDPEVVDVAVEDTRDLLAHMERHAEENRRRILEEEERAWEDSFKPHAVIQTETTIPSQITICGLTGGAERWLIVR